MCTVLPDVGFLSLRRCKLNIIVSVWSRRNKHVQRSLLAMR